MHPQGSATPLPCSTHHPRCRRGSNAHHGISDWLNPRSIIVASRAALHRPASSQWRSHRYWLPLLAAAFAAAFAVAVIMNSPHARLRILSRFLRAASHPTREPGTAHAPRAAAVSLFVLAGAAASLPSSSARADAQVAVPHPSLGAFSALEPRASQEDYGGWSKLALGDIGTALHSAEALVALAADSDNHPALLSSGALPALCVALERALSDTSDAAAPLAANTLRALADLARTTPEAPGFSRLPPLLAAALAKYPVANPEPLPWGEWIYSLVGLRKSADPSSVSSAPAHDGELAPLQLDALTTPSKTKSHIVTVDLRPGIAYHAVRCLSNMARNSSTHQLLLDAGALEVAASVLRNCTVRQLELAVEGNSQLLETIRCAVLCMSALAKSAAHQVVTSKAHLRLIEMTASRADPVAQAYAAAGLRNLARHPTTESADMWQVHRDIVVSGAPQALASALSSTENPQAQVFAVLAFGDLLQSGHHKAHLIRKRLAVAFDAFSKLITAANASVSRAALRVLHTAYSGAQPTTELGTALTPALGQLVQGPLKRGDVNAMRAVASMSNDETLATALADVGLIEVLRTAAERGRGPYFEEAARALASLAWHTSVVQLVAQRGALAAALKRPSVEDGGLHTVSLVANAARDEELRARVAHSGLALVLHAAHSGSADAKREAARALHNLTLGGVSRVMVTQSAALAPLVRLASSEDKMTRLCAVGALAGITETFEYATKVIEADSVRVLVDAARADNEAKRDVARALAHLASNEATHGTLAASDAVPWLVDIVVRGGGRGAYAADTMYFATIAVCNLSYSPGITRRRLRECGVVATLAALASAGMGAPDVAHAARQALANIRAEATPSMIAVDVSSREFVPK